MIPFRKSFVRECSTFLKVKERMKSPEELKFYAFPELGFIGVGFPAFKPYNYSYGFKSPRILPYYSQQYNLGYNLYDEKFDVYNHNQESVLSVLKGLSANISFKEEVYNNFSSDLKDAIQKLAKKKKKSVMELTEDDIRDVFFVGTVSRIAGNMSSTEEEKEFIEESLMEQVRLFVSDSVLMSLHSDGNYYVLGEIRPLSEVSEEDLSEHDVRYLIGIKPERISDEDAKKLLKEGKMVCTRVLADWALNVCDPFGHVSYSYWSAVDEKKKVLGRVQLPAGGGRRRPYVPLWVYRLDDLQIGYVCVDAGKDSLGVQFISAFEPKLNLDFFHRGVPLSVAKGIVEEVGRRYSSIISRKSLRRKLARKVPTYADVLEDLSVIPYVDPWDLFLYLQYYENTPKQQVVGNKVLYKEDILKRLMKMPVASNFCTLLDSSSEFYRVISDACEEYLSWVRRVSSIEDRLEKLTEELDMIESVKKKKERLEEEIAKARGTLEEREDYLNLLEKLEEKKEEVAKEILKGEMLRMTLLKLTTGMERKLAEKVLKSAGEIISDVSGKFSFEDVLSRRKDVKEELEKKMKEVLQGKERKRGKGKEESLPEKVNKMTGIGRKVVEYIGREDVDALLSYLHRYFDALLEKREDVSNEVEKLRKVVKEKEEEYNRLRKYLELKKSREEKIAEEQEKLWREYSEKLEKLSDAEGSVLDKSLSYLRESFRTYASNVSKELERYGYVAKYFPSEYLSCKVPELPDMSYITRLSDYLGDISCDMPDNVSSSLSLFRDQFMYLYGFLPVNGKMPWDSGYTEEFMKYLGKVEEFAKKAYCAFREPDKVKDDPKYYLEKEVRKSKEEVMSKGFSVLAEKFGKPGEEISKRFLSRLSKMRFKKVKEMVASGKYERVPWLAERDFGVLSNYASELKKSRSFRHFLSRIKGEEVGKVLYGYIVDTVGNILTEPPTSEEFDALYKEEFEYKDLDEEGIKSAYKYLNFFTPVVRDTYTPEIYPRSVIGFERPGEIREYVPGKKVLKKVERVTVPFAGTRKEMSLNYDDYFIEKVSSGKVRKNIESAILNPEYVKLIDRSYVDEVSLAVDQGKGKLPTRYSGLTPFKDVFLRKEERKIRKDIYRGTKISDYDPIAMFGRGGV